MLPPDASEKGNTCTGLPRASGRFQPPRARRSPRKPLVRRAAEDAQLEAERRGRLDPSFYAASADNSSSAAARGSAAAGGSGRPQGAYASVGFSYGSADEQLQQDAAQPPPPPPLPTAPSADEPPFVPTFDVPVRRFPAAPGFLPLT